jgi:hypothetical protein
MYTFYLSRLIYGWLVTHPRWVFTSLGVCVVAVGLWLFWRHWRRQAAADTFEVKQISDFSQPAGLKESADETDVNVIVPPDEERKQQKKRKEHSKPSLHAGQVPKNLTVAMKKIEEVRGQVESAARSADKARTDISQLTDALAKLQQEVTTAAAVETVKGKIAVVERRMETLEEDQNTSKRATEKLEAELRELTATLSDEIAARELLLKIPKPLPQHWKALENKWMLLQRNPALRERLVSIWQCGPVQAIGGRYNQLLRLSERQWTAILLQTPDLPMRLRYWRDLHIGAKRQFVGVSNFFRRLQEFGDGSGSSFSGTVDGMTPAEFDFGWPHISDPPPTMVQLSSAQVEQGAAIAAQKLLELWATPVIRLYHELFVVPRYEYDDPESALDEMAAMNDAGFLTIPEDDVRAAARQLDFDYISIAPYQHVSEVTRYLNHSAIKTYEWQDWLGRPQTFDGTIILRVEKLALKKRSVPSEMIGAGASVIIARRVNA